MTAKIQPLPPTRVRILTLLAARTGGNTRREMEGILDAPERTVANVLAELIKAGSITRHGGRWDVPRYTLPGDALTRPVAPCVPLETRRQAQKAHARTVLAELASGHPRSPRFLAARCGITTGAVLHRLRAMCRDGQIERVGESTATRYRLPRVIRVGVGP